MRNTEGFFKVYSKNKEKFNIKKPIKVNMYNSNFFHIKINLHVNFISHKIFQVPLHISPYSLLFVGDEGQESMTIHIDNEKVIF